MTFSIIDQNLEPWDGSPRTLSPQQGVTMASTPVGQLVLAMLNLEKTPNLGQLSLTSGGSPPEIFDVEALLNAPSLEIRNYEGNNLNLTNISSTAKLWIAAYGPGFGNPQALDADGQPVPIPPYQSYTFVSSPSYMRLVLGAPGQYTVFVVYIGSTPFAYAVNSPDDGTVPPGYTRVTAANALPLVDNWLGKTVYVVNLSPRSDAPQQATLTLTKL
jgi:hypothetical protein